MSTTTSPMPDFADALERHLRDAAETLARSATAPEPAVPGLWARGDRAARRPAVLRRPLAAAGSLALVAVVVVAVLLVGGSGTNAPEAQGGPLVLRTPQVALPSYALPGRGAAFVLGPGSERITRGNEIPTAAGPAYLYGDAAGRCLTAPDPASPRPEVERGVTCVPTAALERFGIALRIGDGYLVAAIPPGVRAPTLRVDGATPRELRPSSTGVVAVTIDRPGDVEFYDRDGAIRTEPLRPIAAGGRTPSTPIDPADVPRPGDGRASPIPGP